MVRRCAPTAQGPGVGVYRVGGCHFVIDGHHRISIAPASGERLIEAYVTQVLTAAPSGPGRSPVHEDRPARAVVDLPTPAGPHIHSTGTRTPAVTPVMISTASTGQQRVSPITRARPTTPASPGEKSSSPVNRLRSAAKLPLRWR
jgi:hypothetical protein